jgi:hypothetical protein
MEKLGIMFIKNTRYKILTPNGFKSFKGIKRTTNNTLKFHLSNYDTIEVTKNHKFDNIIASDMNIGDTIPHKDINIVITNITDGKDGYVYDPIDVNGHLYFGNNVINHNCDFLGSTKTVIDANVLELIMENYKNPIDVQLEGKLLIYEKPQEGCKYILGCDVGKGTGEHDSAIQVLKINSLKPIDLEQVAIFKDNMTDVYKFAEIIDRISNYYNKSFIMVENNAEGAAVVNELWWNLENERLVNTGSKIKNLGVRATRSTKPVAVLLMKKLIEDYSVKLVDEHTLNQLSSFIEKNNKFYGDNISDDLVSALYWAVYILKMDVLDEGFEFKKNEKTDSGWGVLTDSDFVIEEDWSWLLSMNNN